MTETMVSTLAAQIVEGRWRFMRHVIERMGVDTTGAEHSHDIARAIQRKYGIHHMVYPDGRQSIASTTLGTEVFFEETEEGGRYVYRATDVRSVAGTA